MATLDHNRKTEHADRAVVRVAVVDDFAMPRQTVVQTLERRCGLVVCMASPWNGLHRVVDATPHAMALHLDGLSGSCARFRRLRELFPHVRTVGYSFTPLPEAATKAMRSLGLDSHVGHESSLSQLAEALAGTDPLNRDDGLLASRGPLDESVFELDLPALEHRVNCVLSDQERAVWRGLGKGLNGREVSQRLGIDYRTVSTYCGRIREKLHLSRCVKLGCLAARLSAGVPSVGDAGGSK